MKVVVKPTSSKKSVTYQSKNKKVVTVSKKGKLKAKKVGTAKIIVKVKGKKGKSKQTWVKIKVSKKNQTTVEDITNTDENTIKEDNDSASDNSNTNEDNSSANDNTNGNIIADSGNNVGETIISNNGNNAGGTVISGGGNNMGGNIISGGGSNGSGNIGSSTNSGGNVEVQKYTINVLASYGGEVKATNGQYVAGTYISLEAVPQDGWEFLNWNSTDGGTFENNKSMLTKFKMPANDTKVIAVFVKEGQKDISEDESIVYGAYNALQIGYQPGDYQDSVTQNLVLDTQYGEKDSLVSISWTSSNEGVINKNGNITRPIDKDCEITLKALLTKGEASLEKEFKVSVKKVNTQKKEDIEDNSIVDIEKLNDSAKYPVEVDYSENKEQVTSIDGKYSDVIIDSPETALDSIYSVKSLIGLENPEAELKCSVVNHNGISLAYTFSQQYNGIRVYGTTVTVSANEETGETQSLHSSVLGTDKLKTLNLTPQMTEEEIKSLYNEAGEILDCDLEIYSLDEYSEFPIMVYVLTIGDEAVIVNANDGSEILRFSLLCDLIGDYSTIGSGQMEDKAILKDEKGDRYDDPKFEDGAIVNFPIRFHSDFLIDSSTLPYFEMEDVERQIYIHGDWAVFDGHRLNKFWDDKTANSAYFNVIQVFDWYKEHFNRNSLDGNGMAVHVNVHSQRKTDAAFWDLVDKKMYFCDNSGSYFSMPTTANSLDTVAHEMTHGVFQHILWDSKGVDIADEKQYPLRDEPGSISEGYADVFGCFVDGNWMMGEGWIESQGYDYLRSVSNPQNVNLENPEKANIDNVKTLCPSKYLGEYYCTEKTDQSKLIHRNCSLISHAAYLMEQYGISGQKLEKLWYDSMSKGYDARSTFYTVRENLIKAAKANNFSDSDLALVRKAFDEEEIYGELGNLKICFVDKDGNSLDLSGKEDVSIELNSDREDVPKTEYTIPPERQVGSSVIMGNGDTSLNSDQNKLPGNLYYGDYELRIDIPGYESVIGTTSIRDGAVTVATITLKEPGENPEKPDNPDTPDTPDTPDKPENPDNPENPDVPDNPENPDTPDVPDKPEEPDTPDTPDNPENPDVPDDPENPDTPDTPDDPEDTFDPEAHGAIIEIGDCGRNGDNVRYTLYEDGTLYIYGSGDMKDYLGTHQNPFYDIHDKYDNIKINEIYIKNGITSIGSSTFYGYCNLVSIKIPSSITRIGGNVFGGCSNLASIDIPYGVTSIAYNVFCMCNNLTNLKIPSSVIRIEDSAFSGCSSLMSIEIPSGVTSIGDDAFGGCSSLVNIEIPSGVTSIGEYAFFGCSSLVNIEIPSGVTSIGYSAFEGCSNLTNIQIPLSVRSIGSGAFKGCSSLTSIEIPSSVTNIEIYAFSNCSSLVSIKIPSSVTSIGDGAFSGCSSLASIKIPSSVTQMWYGIFDGCSNLTIYAPSGSYAEKYAEESNIPFVALDATAFALFQDNACFLPTASFRMEFRKKLIDDELKSFDS